MRFKFTRKDEQFTGSPTWAKQWQEKLENMRKCRGIINLTMYKNAMLIEDKETTLHIPYAWCVDPFMHLADNPQWIYDRVVEDLKLRVNTPEKKEK